MRNKIKIIKVEAGHQLRVVDASYLQRRSVECLLTKLYNFRSKNSQSQDLAAEGIRDRIRGTTLMDSSRSRICRIYKCIRVQAMRIWSKIKYSHCFKITSTQRKGPRHHYQITAVKALRSTKQRTWISTAKRSSFFKKRWGLWTMKSKKCVNLSKISTWM